MTQEEFKDELYKKVKVLNETTWEHRANRPSIDQWLENFKDSKEKVHALYLLSQFMYFGSLQMRELLKSLYRDLYKHPIIEEIRKINGDTVDNVLIRSKFKEVESNTRFLGIGNPSESGTHLLYFFRQENKLRNGLFINTHEIFKNDITTGGIVLADPSISHYVFIDDFCGSGTQAINYSQRVIHLIKKLHPAVQTSYLMLFSTKDGKEQVKANTLFTNVDAVVELDPSFKCFDTDSRYFKNAPVHIDKTFSQLMCETHGRKLIKNMYTELGYVEPDLTSAIERDKLGYKDSQLLLGFHHNTPDNTLPVIWYDENSILWYPAFKRYNKIYGI